MTTVYLSLAGLKENKIVDPGNSPTLYYDAPKHKCNTTPNHERGDPNRTNEKSRRQIMVNIYIFVNMVHHHQ